MDAKKRAIVLALAAAIAAPMEGMRQWAYKDPPGIPTICMGHTSGVKMGDFRTIPECKVLLTEDMNNAISAVEACHPNLPIPVLAAFSDATFNIGPKVACDSTASKYLSTGHYLQACRELLKWDYARVAGVLVKLPGLTKRRVLDYELCTSDMWVPN